MAAVVIGIVWARPLLLAVQFRARRGVTAPQIRGNNPLELGWTLAAAG